MALTLVTPPEGGYLYTEPFGTKGEAELLLRNMIDTDALDVFVQYTPAVSQKLRSAAKKIAESDGRTFTFERCGQSYREVAYAIKRTLKNGTVKNVDVSRRFLNVESVRIVNVQAEADAAIVADAN